MDMAAKAVFVQLDCLRETRKRLRSVYGNTQIGESRACKTTRSVSVEFVAANVYCDRVGLARRRIGGRGSYRVRSPTNWQ